MGAMVAILALIFAAAGIAKLRGREMFRARLRKLLPRALVAPTAVGVPVAELLLAAWLVSGYVRPVAAACAAGMLILFSVVLLRMWRIGLEGCGCFGEEAEGSGFVSALARNLLLIAGALWIAGVRKTTVFEHGWDGAAGQGTVVIGAVCLWVCAAAVARRWKWIGQRSVSA